MLMLWQSSINDRDKKIEYENREHYDWNTKKFTATAITYNLLPYGVDNALKSISFGGLM
ncbi:hypothetical protein SAMN02583745_00878 [Thorsellia anophelis DSM 18579]|uniref:Uncharacterized protein n=1 Tax=Thorsellia anophelis DSM 18579 TaxID=1123402 RepID=A0A1I0ABP5_9GAMM|nr:hypothetical protein SAMN02583745_00878 [Thorsellia anophelis DSM 18579]